MKNNFFWFFSCSCLVSILYRCGHVCANAGLFNKECNSVYVVGSSCMLLGLYLLNLNLVLHFLYSNLCACTST